MVGRSFKVSMREIEDEQCMSRMSLRLPTPWRDGVQQWTSFDKRKPESLDVLRPKLPRRRSRLFGCISLRTAHLIRQGTPGKTQSQAVPGRALTPVRPDRQQTWNSTGIEVAQSRGSMRS